jgi:hypothetical protein
MTGKNEEQYIKIAADSIRTLRRVDVLRVLESIRADNIDGVTRHDLATFIATQRPDLVDEVSEVMREEFPGDGWCVDNEANGKPLNKRVVFVVDYVNPKESEQGLSDLALWAEVSLGRSTVKVKVDVTAYASVEDAFTQEKEKAGRRIAADSLTIAYIAIGARDVLREKSIDLDAFNGELGFIEAVTDHAFFVDAVGDWFDANGGHPSVFAYEVTTPFGAEIARAMIAAGNAGAQPGPLMRKVLIEAGYAVNGVDMAIQGATLRE